MASLCSSLTLLRTAARQGCRSVSTQSSATKKAAPLVVGAVATAAAGFAGYKAYRVWGLNPRAVEEAVKTVQEALPSTTVSAASLPASQPSVYTQTKDHALYLWIHLKPTAKARDVARAVAKLQRYVDEVSDPSMRDEDDEIVAGVGFGPNFYCQVAGKTKENFTYPQRKGALGEMPSTGGDVFVHAKSHQVSKLFELGQVILKNLPKDSVDKFEDIYSFVFRNGRDLSGFIDGTENPADDDDRRDVAVEKSTGGSYVITQKWIHDLNLIGSEKDKTLEGWVGRSREDSTELSRKTITSHVARMTGGSSFQQPKPVQMVRQSMPFGTLAGEAGLFFIGYTASPSNLEFMLDRMVGAGGDGHCDDIMRLSKNVTGTYWYFPGVAELKKME
ncbi:hypothetical protein ACOMHN_020673 [Nucella lapillus]